MLLINWSTITCVFADATALGGKRPRPTFLLTAQTAKEAYSLYSAPAIPAVERFRRNEVRLCLCVLHVVRHSSRVLDRCGVWLFGCCLAMCCETLHTLCTAPVSRRLGCGCGVGPRPPLAAGTHHAANARGVHRSAAKQLRQHGLGDGWGPARASSRSGPDAPCPTPSGASALAWVYCMVSSRHACNTTAGAMGLPGGGARHRPYPHHQQPPRVPEAFFPRPMKDGLRTLAAPPTSTSPM